MATASVIEIFFSRFLKIKHYLYPCPPEFTLTFALDEGHEANEGKFDLLLASITLKSYEVNMGWFGLSYFRRVYAKADFF
jgi:hypothetical protein